jgi:hypothetical protein
MRSADGDRRSGTQAYDLHATMLYLLGSVHEKLPNANAVATAGLRRTQRQVFFSGFYL